MEKIAENIYIIPGPTNIGVITDFQNQIYLIDSGTSNGDAERIKEELDKTFSNYTLKAIINTHSHADHAGGNAFFKEKTNCKIFIQKKEKPLLENSSLHPFLIWGANPLPELCTDYLKIHECEATDIISEKSVLSLENGTHINFIELPGHYFEMFAVLVTSKNARKILFLGDGLLGYKTINRYWISFLIDYKKLLSSFEKINQIKADLYIPSHGEITSSISETVEMNQIAILSTESCILKELKKSPLSTENLVKKVCEKNAINLKLMQYALITSTIKSYLTVMYNEQKVGFTIEDNILLWHLKS